MLQYLFYRYRKFFVKGLCLRLLPVIRVPKKASSQNPLKLNMKSSKLYDSAKSTGEGDNMKWLKICILCFLMLTGVMLGAGKTENKTATDIFVQEGSGGSFVNDSSGNSTLIMKDVVPYTMFFADRPARDVGLVPMDKFLKGFPFGVSNPPNAVIILPDENETSDMVVVELTNPQYNNTTQTLTYAAKKLEEYSFKSGWLNDHWSEVDPAIPEKFGNVELVIDGCPCAQVSSGCSSGCRNQCFKVSPFPWCYPCGGCCGTNSCTHK